jgi:hypothetical protein
MVAIVTMRLLHTANPNTGAILITVELTINFASPFLLAGAVARSFPPNLLLTREKSGG